MSIPIIDLFAGPGGLGEGFSSLQTTSGERIFKIAISVEKEACAHKTLQLRAFTREFEPGEIPSAYYDYLRGAITKEGLFSLYPKQARRAASEAWLAELGSESTPNSAVDARIREALQGTKKPWVLIGGPPCQAYSLVGRSRMLGGNPDKYATDHRHFLYREYLRILAVHQPAVFVMENVKGLLSASLGGEKTLSRIMDDLEKPATAVSDGREGRSNNKVSYTLHTLRPYKDMDKRLGAHADFVINCEDHGIPQARHRLIIVGVRSDLNKTPTPLLVGQPVNIEDVIGDLPRLRSGISKEPDSGKIWAEAIQRVGASSWSKLSINNYALRDELTKTSKQLDFTLRRGAPFIQGAPAPSSHKSWFVDKMLGGFCNHDSRSHMRSDLHRYFYAATFAALSSRAPQLKDFPEELLPNHDNIQEAIEGTKFSDRFRVQCQGRPSTTIVSHIAKDGHYFIHYDPSQCRSLTVREAARLQTFPDNYFFEGARTDQYRQVGNAVPPLLARQIAAAIAKLLL